MKIIMARSEKEWNLSAAKIIARQIIAKPDSIIGFDVTLKTHSYYTELVTVSKQLNIDWSEVRATASFEYIGIDENHPCSVHGKLCSNLFNLININRDNIFIPDPCHLSVAANCKNYEAAITSLGGIDLQILDLSHDGTIGMNIPNTLFNNNVFTINVDSIAVEQKARFVPNEFIPVKCIAMGVRMLMQAKSILLTAKGKELARLIKDLLVSDISPANPASALLLHPNVTIMLDEDASSLMW